MPLACYYYWIDFWQDQNNNFYYFWIDFWQDQNNNFYHYWIDFGQDQNNYRIIKTCLRYFLLLCTFRLSNKALSRTLAFGSTYKIYQRNQQYKIYHCIVQININVDTWKVARLSGLTDNLLMHHQLRLAVWRMCGLSIQEVLLPMVYNCRFG